LKRRRESDILLNNSDISAENTLPLGHLNFVFNNIRDIRNLKEL